ILSAFYPVTGSQGSLNTPFATAETLLATEKKHEFCILEIGGFKTGALDLPMRLFTPKISVLTNIGKEHISAFKGKGEGVEGIAAEKAKLIKALPVDGTA